MDAYQRTNLASLRRSRLVRETSVEASRRGDGSLIDGSVGGVPVHATIEEKAPDGKTIFLHDDCLRPWSEHDNRVKGRPLPFGCPPAPGWEEFDGLDELEKRVLDGNR